MECLKLFIVLELKRIEVLSFHFPLSCGWTDEKQLIHLQETGDQTSAFFLKKKIIEV